MVEAVTDRVANWTDTRRTRPGRKPASLDLTRKPRFRKLHFDLRGLSRTDYLAAYARKVKAWRKANKLNSRTGKLRVKRNEHE